MYNTLRFERLSLYFNTVTCTVFSLQLLEQFLQMLTVAQLFDSSQNGTYVGDHLDVCRSAIRILLTCIAREEKQVGCWILFERFEELEDWPSLSLSLSLTLSLHTVLCDCVSEVRAPCQVSKFALCRHSLYSQQLGQKSEWSFGLRWDNNYDNVILMT